jgi:hypothetical protein
MTHDELQQAIIDLAGRLGWMHYHTHDSRHSDAGFPDLVLVHAGKHRVVWIEVKTAGGIVTAAQEAWHDALARCDEEIYVVYPIHLDEIPRVLMLDHKPGIMERLSFNSAVVFYE